MTDIIPDRLRRHRSLLENMRAQKREMIQQGLLTNMPTKDTTNSLLTAILDTIQTEEEAFAHFQNRWSNLISIAPTGDTHPEIVDWLRDRRANSTGTWGHHDNIYGFDDPDLAFEFKMRWA